MGAVLRVLVDTLRVVATLLQPFMPTSMGTMLEQLGVPIHARTIAALDAPLADGIFICRCAAWRVPALCRTNRLTAGRAA